MWPARKLQGSGLLVCGVQVVLTLLGVAWLKSSRGIFDRRTTRCVGYRHQETTTKGPTGLCRIGRSGGRGLLDERVPVAFIFWRNAVRLRVLLRKKWASVGRTADDGQRSCVLRTAVFFQRFAKRNAYKFGGVVL